MALRYMTHMNGGSTTNPSGFIAYFTCTLNNSSVYTLVHNFGQHVHQVYTANDVDVVMTIEDTLLPAASSEPYISAKTANRVIITTAAGAGPTGNKSGRLRVYARVPHSVAGRARP